MASYPNATFDICGIACGYYKIPFMEFLSATVVGKAFIKAPLQALFTIFWFLPTVEEYKDESGWWWFIILFTWWLFVTAITLMFFKSCIEMIAEKGRELQLESPSATCNVDKSENASAESDPETNTDPEIESDNSLQNNVFTNDENVNEQIENKSTERKKNL